MSAAVTQSPHFSESDELDLQTSQGEKEAICDQVAFRTLSVPPSGHNLAFPSNFHLPSVYYLLPPEKQSDHLSQLE